MSPTNVFRASEQEVQRLAELCLVRYQLLEQGYEPIPTRGKEPLIRGWSNGPIDRDRILRETIKHRDHRNTGLRTGRLVGVDIDLHDDMHAEVMRELIEDIAGPASLRRRGSKGMMLCYQKIGDPIGKIKITESLERAEIEAGMRPKTLVEIFGQGGQFVAYGIHPTTNKPYRWLKPGQEPLRVPLNDLPAVDTKMLFAMRDIVQAGLLELGYRVSTQTETLHAGPRPSVGTTDDAIDVTALFLSLLPAGRAGRNYINFICPACRCDDKRSGFGMLANGGFYFHCFHAGCEFNKTTGWQPPSPYVGQRVIRLYELLGGDPAELRRRKGPILQGYQSLAEMLAEFRENAEGAKLAEFGGADE